MCHAVWETAPCSAEGKSFSPSPAKQGPKPRAGPGVTWKRAEWRLKRQIYSLDKGRFMLQSFSTSMFLLIKAFCLLVWPDVSLTLKMQHVLAKHKGREEEELGAGAARAPRRAPAWDLLRVGRDEARDFTIHCWKTCLLLTARYFKREVSALKRLIRWY